MATRNGWRKFFQELDAEVVFPKNRTIEDILLMVPDAEENIAVGDDSLNQALYWAGRGWHVLPVHSIVNSVCTCDDVHCQHKGKHPKSKNGFKDATTDVSTIKKWFSQEHHANLGVRTGMVSGIVVLDIDPKNRGDASLKSLEESLGTLPLTPEVYTGGGGKHIYFKHPGFSVKSSVGRIAPGIDIRADGAYCILPPSQHESGQVYRWHHHPDVVELATLPVPLLQMLKTRGQSSLSPRPDNPPSDLIPEGRRNNTLASLAGKMRKTGMTEDEILPALLVINRNRCKPPLSDAEVEKIACSISRYESGNGTTGKANSGRVSSVQIDEGNQAVVSYTELMSSEPTQPDFQVENLIQTGFGIFGGRPKVGKSFMNLQRAVAAASGSSFLGHQARQMKTLYLALEDNQNRIRKRLDLLFQQSLQKELPLDFWFDPIPPDQLEKLILQKNYELVLIDTFNRYFKRLDNNDPSQTTIVMAHLHDITRRHGVNIEITDHHKKPGLTGHDLIDDIMGSTAKSAVPDYVIGLYRVRGQRRARLCIDGRDVGYKELKIECDDSSLLWHGCTGSDGRMLSALEDSCLSALDELGREATAPQISKKIGKDRSNVRKAMVELERKGLVASENNDARGKNARVLYTRTKDDK